MTEPISPDNPADHLFSVSAYRHSFDADLRLRRRAERGDFERVRRGQYFPTDRWHSLTEDMRYAVRVQAAVAARIGDVVVSHHSAAVLLGLPFLFGPPREVHFIIPRAGGGRSDPGVRKHAVGVDPRDVVIVNGIRTTSVARTVIDLAATLDLMSAVAIADRALYVDRQRQEPPLTTKAELFEVWQRMLPFRGSARARAVIEFATDLAGSPNESACRVNIALNGFPEPVLQHPFVVDGKEVFVDFYFPDEGKVGGGGRKDQILRSDHEGRAYPRGSALG